MGRWYRGVIVPDTLKLQAEQHQGCAGTNLYPENKNFLQLPFLEAGLRRELSCDSRIFPSQWSFINSQDVELRILLIRVVEIKFY